MNQHPNRRVFATALLAGLAPSIRAEAADTLSIAIVPQFTTEEIFMNWTPVLRKLEGLSGLRTKLQFYRSIPEFEDAFLKGIPDLAYMNPFHAVMANAKQGYIPIIRDKSAPLEGILVVRQDSPVHHIKELAGATLAFPAPNAFGASLYMRALLARTHKLDFTSVYAQTHSNAYRQVIAGKAAAAGGVLGTLKAEEPVIQSQLRIIYKTPPSPSHPVVVHPRIPLRVRTALQQAFIALGRNENDRDLLQKIQLTHPDKSSFGDYAALKNLGLEEFAVPPSL